MAGQHGERTLSPLLVTARDSCRRGQKMRACSARTQTLARGNMITITGGADSIKYEVCPGLEMMGIIQISSLLAKGPMALSLSLSLSLSLFLSLSLSLSFLFFLCVRHKSLRIST